MKKDKAFNPESFLEEVQSYYMRVGERPQMRNFSRSPKACAYFGSWKEVLRQAGIPWTTPSETMKQLNYEKSHLWKEIVAITHDAEWHLNRQKVERVHYLREHWERVSKEIRAL